MFSLLKPTFSLLDDPQLFTLLLLLDTERSSTDFSHTFGKLLSPIHFRRKTT
jgi:hypothetical protein